MENVAMTDTRKFYQKYLDVRKRSQRTYATLMKARAAALDTKALNAAYRAAVYDVNQAFKVYQDAVRAKAND